MNRTNYSSPSPWEDTVGYSRAVQVGNQLFISGTTATAGDGSIIAPGDPYAQAKAIFQKIEGVLQDAGFALADVVRTRMFVTDIAQWEAVGKAHGEVFRTIKPAATMVEVSKLIHRDLVVEIEVEALRQPG